MEANEWERLNRERGQLIDKQIAGSLSPDEAKRLEELQSAADKHLEPLQPKIPRLAFAPIVDAGGFSVGLAEESSPGYLPQRHHGAFPSWEAARAKASELNRSMFRLSDEDAAMIVASSMGAQNERNRRRR